ncbi:restriction endonuclease subunit S [Vibrio vulnificus]
MKPYPRYNQSSARWYSSFPENWSEVKAKRLFSNERERASSEDEQLAASQKYGVIPQALMMAQNNAKVMLALKGTDNFKQVKENDFVISLRSFEGGIEHSKYNGCISPAYTVLRLRHESSYPNYFRYALKCSPFIQALNSTSEGIRDGKTITYDEFGELLVALPSQAEQKAIATFLDRETQRIDSLIEEKQTFIKLLKEKRQALISHVVTKGLNPNVEMQDSGIEWIGQVPKHWNITSLKSVSTVVDPNPSHRNPEYVDNGFPFISTKEFTGIDGIELDTLRRVSEDTVIEQEKRCEFREGSIAFSRKGTIGEVRILPHNIRFALLDSVCVINAGETVSYQYLYLQAKSSVYDSQLGAVVRGAALKQVSVGKVRDLLTLCPPIDEQNQIVTYIDQQLEKLDKLVVETSTSLSLLKERRISLISAAVTGKIDVREAV